MDIVNLSLSSNLLRGLLGDVGESVLHEAQATQVGGGLIAKVESSLIGIHFGCLLALVACL